MSSKNPPSLSSTIYTIIIALLAVAAAGWASAWRLRSQLVALKQSACRYDQMEPRNGNMPFIDPLYRNDEALRQSMLLNEEPQTDAEREQVLRAIEDWPSLLDEHGMSAEWRQHLNRMTPSAFQHVDDGIDCNDVSQVSISNAANWSADKRVRAARLLRECGFVALKSFFKPSLLQQVLQDFRLFVNDKQRSDPFLYPCQGVGRIEYMLPFEPPFNTSSVYIDARLHQLLFEFFAGRFKMELQTIIESKSGSGNQRWHQGYQYLFHPHERLPPYAIVVGVPLVDVDKEMGPTEFCPRKKLRFYQGYTCPNNALSLPSKLGDIILFDYKTLHRGPSNPTNRDRPMMSLVFSKPFFLNVEPIVNRGVSLLQTIHQRRYWEQFYFHPEKEELFFKV